MSQHKKPTSANESIPRQSGDEAGHDQATPPSLSPNGTTKKTWTEVSLNGLLEAVDAVIKAGKRAAAIWTVSREVHDLAIKILDAISGSFFAEAQQASREHLGVQLGGGQDEPRVISRDRARKIISNAIEVLARVERVIIELDAKEALAGVSGEVADEAFNSLISIIERNAGKHSADVVRATQRIITLRNAPAGPGKPRPRS